jgi:hypothetical protein
VCRSGYCPPTANRACSRETFVLHLGKRSQLLLCELQANRKIFRDRNTQKTAGRRHETVRLVFHVSFLLFQDNSLYGKGMQHISKLHAADREHNDIKNHRHSRFILISLRRNGLSKCSVAVFLRPFAIQGLAVFSHVPYDRSGPVRNKTTAQPIHEDNQGCRGRKHQG